MQVVDTTVVNGVVQTVTRQGELVTLTRFTTLEGEDEGRTVTDVVTGEVITVSRTDTGASDCPTGEYERATDHCLCA